MIAVTHVGPDIYSFGGTQSVIRVIRDNRIGADEIRVLSTWNGRHHAKNLWLTARAGAALARAPRGSVVHFHMSNGGAWLREGPLIRLARARGFRVVVTIHGSDFPQFSRSHPHFVGSTLTKADHLIVLSEEARAAAKRVAPGVPVSIVANPVVIDRDAPGAGSTPPVVLFAGTIGRRKGVDTLVSAWRLLLAEGVEGRCRIVGVVDDYTPPPTERLSVEPPVHPDRVRELLRSVRVVTLPSFAEAMPMILTEALAGGRPFVATPVGGTPEIASDPGMLVPAGDASALAAAIGRYLRDPELAERDGRRGQEHIAATRSPRIIDAELRRIYEGCGVGAS
ncbi:glycosyl transferase family 1 [Mycobacterium sp. 852002-53434_SCH5985345]|uniref:glycosyltransferase family 4 protein n=1 Tax=unclassified Mycobacterium TaxID=2642494 RepID=UPI0007FDA42E|nr:MULTISPECIES: glycosyltransferase family 4 protein [unclassified Mycobacterium]OBF49871.1 glycosyl transferase family 1 [Mycobacterium sp. 852002-53434_SCH5985345]OBF70959.1 glycosyl transferase family 1 [Mycobacterium sp. 852002-51613_SCH5001154]OBF94070.1 glycosyl transferase family 1 [Mycobacterium sp. 852014-52450_SCH5900713]